MSGPRSSVRNGSPARCSIGSRTMSTSWKGPAKASGWRPARELTDGRPEDRTRQPNKPREEPPPRTHDATPRDNQPGLRSPSLLTRLVHFHAAIWHNLSPPLTHQRDWNEVKGCEAAVLLS